MRGFQFSCEDIVANFSGASSGHITVNNTISATLSGASVLRYDGSPTIIRSDLSGGSRLERR